MPTKASLEILISTMNRVNFDFLNTMFPNHKLDELKLLIINQTKLNELLISTQKNVRVINTHTFGLSKSRNLALKNAKASVVLLADDDVIYLKNFKETILKAHEKYNSAALISFQFLNSNMDLQKKYASNEKRIQLLHQNPLSSVEITLKIDLIRKYNILFNENFGLGAEFPAHEEQLFALELLKKKLEIVYYPKPILIHPQTTSGANPASVSFVKSLTAQKFLIYRNITYLWLIKYVFFLFRKNYIPLKETLTYYALGIQAINQLKKITSEIQN